MRCKNCGWENPDNQTKCEKCHSSLVDTGTVYNHAPSATGGLKGTVAEKVVFADEQQGYAPAPGGPKTCPKCGYPVSDNSTSCPNCFHELIATPTAAEVKSRPHIQRNTQGTVLGGPVVGPSAVTIFCTLRPIAWAGEEVNYNPVTYSGDQVVLNRANTDANNNSITSHEQAVITCENGEWYIENRSDLRTTFIRVNGKVKLTDGDIIVLGNREFEFKGH